MGGIDSLSRTLPGSNAGAKIAAKKPNDLNTNKGNDAGQGDHRTKPTSLNDTTIVLSPEMRKRYPNAPKRIHFDIYDNIQSVQDAGGDPQYAGGLASHPTMISKLTNTGYIALARSDDPEQLAKNIGHELHHIDLYQQGSKKEIAQKYFSQKYHDMRPGEISADSAGAVNRELIQSDLGGFIKAIQKDYDPKADPLSNLNVHEITRDVNGKIISK